MSNAKRLLALATAITACASLAGCGEDTNWIAEHNGEKINAGIYLYYELSAYNTALSYVQTTNQSATEVTEDDVYYITDTKETVNAYDWIQQKAIEDLETYLVVESEYERLNLELTEAEEDTAQQMLDYYCNTLGYAENYTENGIGEDSLLKLYENSTKYTNLFYALYGTYEKIGDDGKSTEIEGELYIDDETLWDHYDEHNVRVKIIEIPLYGENSAALTDEEKAEATLLAEEFLARAEDGENFDDLIEEYKASLEDDDKKEDDKDTAEDKDDESSADDSSTSESESSDDDSSKSEADDSEDKDEEEEEEDKYPNETIVSDESKSYSEAVIEKLFELELGDDGVAYELITDTDVNNELYVVMKSDLREREDLFEDNRDSILADYAGEDYEAYLEGLVENLSYTLNQDAYDRYTPKKVDAGF